MHVRACPARHARRKVAAPEGAAKRRKQMRKSRFGIAAASVLALCAVAGPAYAVSFVVTATDGDESKFFFNKKSLANTATGATFFGSTPGNTTAENVDVTTVGTISNLGNGFGSVDGNNTGSDHLTSLTFTPTTGTTFDGFFFRGQLQDLDTKATDPNNGQVTITVNGTDVFTESNLGIEEDITDLGVEAINDTTAITSIKIQAGPGEYFKEFKQVQLSGVNGVVINPTGGPTPEPAAWIVMIAGFGLLGSLLRLRSRSAFKGIHSA
jgi:hypothetical protein